MADSARRRLPAHASLLEREFATRCVRQITIGKFPLNLFGVNAFSALGIARIAAELVPRHERIRVAGIDEAS
jgi:hypothetical protein